MDYLEWSEYFHLTSDFITDNNLNLIIILNYINTPFFMTNDFRYTTYFLDILSRKQFAEF